MQAWICAKPSGLDGLRWSEWPTPEPGPGQVRVAVRAASLNYPDWLVVHGRYQVQPTPPFVPGAEFSGIVDAVGPGVGGIAPGDRVAAIGVGGAFATQACVAAAHTIALPAEVDLDEAAAFAFTHGTAWHALADRGALRAGETVLVLGAAGGIGTAAIAVARALGARVVAVASTAAKRQACLALGAEFALDAAQPDWRDAVRRATGGRGPDVVVDPVGGALAEPALRSLAWRGRYLVVGFTAGIPALPWNLPLLKGNSIVGVYWGEFVRREPAAHAAAMRELIDHWRAGRIRPHLHVKLPMTDLPQALAQLAAREVCGKLVLVNAPL